MALTGLGDVQAQETRDKNGFRIGSQLPGFRVGFGFDKRSGLFDA